MTSTMGQVRVDERGGDAETASGPEGNGRAVGTASDGRTPGAATIETFDPRTGTLLAVVPDQTADEVRAAVARARAAGTAWSALTARERSRHMLAVRDRLLDRAEELVRVICAETGKQAAEAVTTELMAVCETIDWYARNSERILRAQPVGSGTMAHKSAWKRYEPLGVIGVISPWNYPFTLSMTPVITALFAGNTVVLKPSEVTPTVGLAIGALFEDDTWGDVVQVVTGGGATGEALVRSGVDKIVFTGSVRTGRRVMAAAADTLTPVLLELGGKDPMVVCEDADVVRAAKGAVWGSMQNSGQTCMSVERVYVHESVYDRFVSLVLSEVAAIRQDDHGGDIGSMTFEPQLQIIEAHLADALDKGATVLAGGSRLDRDGLWFPPTVVVDVDHDMDLMTEETFGPVLPIMKVSSDEEAVALANDSRYGLNSSVWTEDSDRGVHIANRLQAGNVCINDCIVSYAVTGLPFGGVKSSGIGRVHGAEGLREMSIVKSILAPRVRTPRELWWFPVPRNLDRIGIATLRARFGGNLRTKLGRRPGV
ncbi:MAG TPA: aldehyde dehydrogenase family protein [Microthrixaceae bacterium]|nr:aldehyde dehydrogenase family protein [Microthrixaceae bacterium]